MENKIENQYIVFHKDLEFEKNGVSVEIGTRYRVNRVYEGVYFIEDESERMIGIDEKAIDKDITLELEI